METKMVFLEQFVFILHIGFCLSHYYLFPSHTVPFCGIENFDVENDYDYWWHGPGKEVKSGRFLPFSLLLLLLSILFVYEVTILLC